MISLAILSFLAGAVLGLWFRVPVLVLAIMLALIVVVGAGAATEVNRWWIALEALVVMVCLQLGYIPGIIIATYTGAREYRDRQRVARDTISDFWPP
jgi:NADH:ubiquinone oxidoreductase subunit 6 (subunit J)